MLNCCPPVRRPNVFEHPKLPLGSEHSRNFLNSQSRIINRTEHHTGKDEIELVCSVRQCLSDAGCQLDVEVCLLGTMSCASTHRRIWFEGVEFDGWRRLRDGLEEPSGSRADLQDAAGHPACESCAMRTEDRPVHNGTDRIVDARDEWVIDCFC